MAKIRKRYNQVPHLTQDTTWERNKYTINITNRSQEDSPFPAGDHKATMNRRESMRNTIHKSTNDPQTKYRLGPVSKKYLTGGLKLVTAPTPPLVQMWIKTHRCLVCMKGYHLINASSLNTFLLYDFTPFHV